MKGLQTTLILIVIISCSGRKNVVPTEDRFKESVISLRQVGLFEDYKGLNDDELTRMLIEKAKKKHEFDGFSYFGEVYNTADNEYFDLRVAELDDKRVWWRDLEADICKENLVYTATIKEFEKLSGGFLNPDKIKEDWKSDEGPIEISFWDRDTLRVFHPAYYDDWYDTDFFQFVESSMASNGSPYKLFMYEESGQDVFVIRATEMEKTEIEKKMNWKLVKF